jgi:hypothetical protein
MDLHVCRQCSEVSCSEDFEFIPSSEVRGLFTDVRPILVCSRFLLSFSHFPSPSRVGGGSNICRASYCATTTVPDDLATYAIYFFHNKSTLDLRVSFFLSLTILLSFFDSLCLVLFCFLSCCSLPTQSPVQRIEVLVSLT